MAELVAQNIDNILKDYIDSDKFNIDFILNNYPQLFNCQIRYTNYNQSVTGSAAKLICEYQNFIYKMAAYAKDKNGDARKLTNKEKKELEVVFEVRKGSTELITDVTKQFKEILDMIPEEYRACVFIVFMLLVFFTYNYNKHLKHKETMRDKDFVQDAMNKLSQKDDKLIEILEQTDKAILDTISNIDDTVEYQGEQYTKEDLKELRKIKYPRKSIPKKVEAIEGNFIVTQINIKRHYIMIENNEEVQKILYADDLIANMQDFKTRFKQAIDDEGKIFYIKASRVVQNKKKGDLVLSDIKEI